MDLDVGVDTEWDTKAPEQLLDRYNFAMVRHVAAWLRPFCDYLLLVGRYPSYYIGNLERWIIPVACEQQQSEAIQDLYRLVEELNSWSFIEAELVEVNLSGSGSGSWIMIADEEEEQLAHEGNPDPQEYLSRQNVVIRVGSPSLRWHPFEIEFLFFERFYEPAFQEFED